MTNGGSRKVESPLLPVLLAPRGGLQRQGGVFMPDVLDGRIRPSSPEKSQEAPAPSADLPLLHLCSQLNYTCVSVTKTISPSRYIYLGTEFLLPVCF